MKKLLISVLAISLMVQVGSVLAHEAGDVEALIEADLGIGPITTYLDFTKTGVGDTRESLSLDTADNTWGYPDKSDGLVWVNGNCLDEKSHTAADFIGTISGLTPDTECVLYVVAAGRRAGDGIGTYDFAWGTSTDGSPVNIVSGVDGAPYAVYIAESVGSLGEITTSTAVLIGIFTSDANGELAIWIGKGQAFDGDSEYRTQLDGMVVGEVGPDFNLPPEVDAGTFMGALVDTATQLDAYASDYGQPEPPSLTYAWLQLSGPGTATAIFSPSPNIEDPCVTFPAVGVYELRLSVSDSELDACDVLDVLVRATDDPVAHWNFETGTGTNVADRSPNNNFGTFAGDPEPNWVSGWVGDWSLDVADNSYVKITTDPVADPNLNAMYGAVTVSAWVKVDEWMSSSWDGIVTKGDGGAGGAGGWSLIRNSSNDSLAFYTPGAGIARGSVNVKDGYWHHVVGVHNGTTISLYVDGLPDGSAEASGLLNPNTAELWINGNSEVADRFFDGQIDDVQIYNYAISESKIAELLAMGQGFPPQVDAGLDATFYVQNGSYQLAATVTDETPPPATLLWTKETGLGTVEFSNATIEDPTVTFSEADVYTLRLTADDPLAVVYDEVIITVKNPICNDVIADGELIMGDISGPAGDPDCYIDLYDFAAFAGNWLRCNNPQDPECEFPY